MKELADIVAQLKICRYTTPEGLRLEDNQAFSDLEKQAESERLLPADKVMLIKAGMRDIVRTCERMTSGNVAHNALSVRAIALKLEEII